ncbi:MAG: FIST N-terminal domain-containing protein [Saprospiraceae bacterium]
MNTHAFVAQGPNQLIEQINECSQSFQPTLAIVFCSVSQDIDLIRQVFVDQNIALFGCTTAGEICNTNYYDQAITCLLFDLDTSLFNIFLADDPNQSTYQLAYTSGQYADLCFDNPALLILSGGVRVNAEQIIAGMKAGLRYADTPIFGGLAGDDMHFKQTYAFSSLGKTDDGLLSLIFNRDKVEVVGLATSGWQPIGLEHVITKANENIVYTINDIPALDFFIKYFGTFNDATAENNLLNDFENVSAQYPLQVIRDDGSYILRSPLIADLENRALILAGGVKEGDRFRFSMSPGFKVIENTISEFVDWKKEHSQADASIFFSCIGRHSALGPMIDDEIAGIYRQWNKPMIGFFSYGEIGATKDGQCDFHNETCSVVLLREK